MPLLRNLTLSALLLMAAVAATPITADFENPTLPPPNLGSSELSKDAVLERYARAIAEHRHFKTRIAHYTIAESGLTGTQDTIASDQDSIVTTVLGSLHYAQGSLAGQAWSQNANGEVTLDKGVHQNDEVDASVLREPLQHLQDISLLGTSSDPYAYVLRVDPPNGRLKFVFIDAKTFSIVRTETALYGRRYVTTYDDFKSTEGHLEPWHFTQDDGYATNHREFTLTSVSYDAPVTASAFAIPAASFPTSLGSAPALVSNRILSDRIIVTTQIEGRSVNLQLDSGAAGILIDRPILDALKIPTLGTVTGTTAGSYTAGQAIVPKITFGGVTMRNVVVESAPFAMMADEHTPVAGLLGFDFIDSVVLHIDYANGRVDALDPKTFTPPAHATRIPIALDDGQPMISASIGNATGSLFVVDTGDDRSTLFSPFTTAHPSAVSDQGLGEQIQAAAPFAYNFHGVGGLVAFTEDQVANFRFGNLSFNRWLFLSTHEASFERDDDGLIGQDVLRYFDVYFDYQHGAMYVAPNQRYTDRFGT